MTASNDTVMNMLKIPVHFDTNAQASQDDHDDNDDMEEEVDQNI